MSLLDTIKRELGESYRGGIEEDTGGAGSTLNEIYERIFQLHLPSTCIVEHKHSRITVRDLVGLSRATTDDINAICDSYPVTVTLLGTTTLFIEEEEDCFDERDFID